MRARNGFTLFELLAVITIIGIVLAVTLGSYHGWGDAQAVRGSAEVVESALNYARDYATSRRVPVSFEYQTAIGTTNGIKKVAQYQLIQETSVEAATNATATAVLPKNVLGPVQRLPGSVWIIRQWPVEQIAEDASDRFVFLPSGKVIHPIPARNLQLFVVSRKMRRDGLPNMLYQLTVNPENGTVSATKLNPNNLGTAP